MRAVLANLGVALASLAFVLGLSELVARFVLDPPAPPNLTRVPPSIRAPAPFQGVPYLLRADAETTQTFASNPRGYFDGEGTLTYHTNSLGWRTREFELDKADGTFRILGLGDSFTFGTGVRREHTFMSLLGASLAGEAVSNEVLNLGVMGFNTAHELALLKNLGVDLDPDLVVITYVLNDAQVITVGRLAGEADVLLLRRELREHGWLGQSMLARHVATRLDNRRARQRAVERIRSFYEGGAPGWVAVRAALGRAAALSREHGFALVLMIFPNLWELNEDYPFAEVHEKVRAAAERVGIPALDLIDAFRGKDGVSLWVHPSNQHPNERAHATAAAALERFLRQRKLLGQG